jgi:hypothetical protein
LINKLTAHKATRQQAAQTFRRIPFIGNVADLLSALTSALNLLITASKLFRVDRKVEIIQENKETLDLLMLIFAAKTKFCRPTNFDSPVARTKEASILVDLATLRQLLEEMRTSADPIEKIACQDADEWVGKLDLDKYIQGSLIADAMNDTNNNPNRKLVIDVEARILKTKKSACLLCGEILVASAEVHLTYRLYITGGSLIKSHVIIKASDAERVNMEAYLSKDFDFDAGFQAPRRPSKWCCLFQCCCPLLIRQI